MPAASLPAAPSDPNLNPAPHRGWAVVSLSDLNTGVLTRHGLTLHEDAVLFFAGEKRGVAVAAFLQMQTEHMRTSKARGCDPCVAIALLSRVEPEESELAELDLLASYRLRWRVDCLDTANHVRFAEADGDGMDALKILRQDYPAEYQPVGHVEPNMVVGHGPKNSLGRARRVAVRDLLPLAVGDLVDGLLSDGRIIRVVLRRRVGELDDVVAVEGFRSVITVCRVRPMGGFANTAGYRYLSEVPRG